MKTAPCDAKRLGLAGGIFWGAAVFLMSLFAMATGYGGLFVRSIGTIYVGYAPTVVGSVLSLVYGFFDGFIGLNVLALAFQQSGLIFHFFFSKGLQKKDLKAALAITTSLKIIKSMPERCFFASFWA